MAIFAIVLGWCRGSGGTRGGIGIAVVVGKLGGGVCCSGQPIIRGAEVKGEHEVLVLDGKGSIGDFSQVVNCIFL